MEAHDEELGPVDIVVIAYPAGSPMTGEAAPILVDLAQRGIIRVLDALFVLKEEDGRCVGFHTCLRFVSVARNGDARAWRSHHTFGVKAAPRMAVTRCDTGR